MTVLLTSCGEKLAGAPSHIRRWLLPLACAELATGIDCRLIGAVMDRESIGGEVLKPRGPGGLGDKGRGHGLMQIDVRYHPRFVADRLPTGELMWQAPTWNVLYGATLLATNLTALDGSFPAAVAAYNASIDRVLKVYVSGLEGDALVDGLDALTTGGNYVSDVLTRARKWGLAI
jgi:hypothetical protein